MKLFEFPFLADENIHPSVIASLQGQMIDVVSVSEADLLGESDETLLQFAFDSGRVVLTHDSDFGMLTLAQKKPIIGILYLRPGHIRPAFTIELLNSLSGQSLEVESPFIVVGTRNANKVRIRVRHL